MKSKKFKVGSVWTRVLVAGLPVGLAPQPADAAVTAFTYDPTDTQVYFRFGAKTVERGGDVNLPS